MKKCEETGDDGCIHYCDCGDGFIGVCICRNLLNRTL